MLNLSLALLTEIEISTLNALITDSSERELCTTIALDMSVNHSFRNYWTLFHFSLNLKSHFVNNARQQLVNFSGDHMLKLLLEELFAWERATTFRS